MQLSFECIQYGTGVYVQLGYLTVKHGTVVGHRITSLDTLNNTPPSIEYLIHWFGDGDRADGQEWFPSSFVKATPNEAFGKP